MNDDIIDGVASDFSFDEQDNSQQEKFFKRKFTIFAICGAIVCAILHFLTIFGKLNF